ncbi:MAG: VanW family protein [Butyricicoccus sp.]|nr:VanW family protein [Butyricicoccus sp.]
MEKRHEGSSADRSLEDILQEMNGHKESTGNSALDAMLRARDKEPSENGLAGPYSEPLHEDDSTFEPFGAFENLVPAGHSAPAAFAEPAKTRKSSRSRTRKKKNKKGGAWKKAAAIAGAAVVVLAGGTVGYTYGYSGIHFGMQAGAVKVGGMSLEEAQKAIDQAGSDLLDGKAITLTIYDKDYTIDIASVTTGMDSEQSAKEAYDYTHDGGLFTRIGHTFTALVGQGEAPLSVSVDDEALTTRLDEIAAEALTEPVNPSWTVEGDKLVIDTGKPGVSFDRDVVSKAITLKIRTMDFEPYEVKVTTSDPAPVDVDQIAAEAQTQPKNATVDKSDGKTIVPSVDGVSFDVDEAKAIVGDGSAQTYEIPITRTPAKVSADKLADVLFRDTLASTSTNLNEGNKPRTNNVRLACKYINGTILNPGEEFSYNNVVGQRTAERGFQSAGAYANGQLIDEVGGGVCQPSSTLYMAVLRADLEVTERHNHSLTVAYTPLGEDATVSWGGPDFRFKNNTDYPIKIVASQSGGAMYVEILGTKTSDKKVTLKTEILETLDYDVVEQTDASLAPGARETKQSGATGYKTVTYKTVTENGQSTTTKANTSSYKKRDKIVLVGPSASTEPATTDTADATSNA